MIVSQCDLDQPAHLSRVSAKIAGLILAFTSARLAAGAIFLRFRMGDLLAFVRAADPTIAPDSPSRVLRELRARGLVSYRVVSRRESLYELVSRPTEQERMGTSERMLANSQRDCASRAETSR